MEGQCEAEGFDNCLLPKSLSDGQVTTCNREGCNVRWQFSRITWSWEEVS